MQGLADALALLAMLIALDNAEHLAAAVAVVAEAVYRSAPRMHLLVTSQVPLKVSEEHVYQLGPLALPEGTPSAVEAQNYAAVALFNARAQAVDRQVSITDDNVATVIGV